MDSETIANALGNQWNYTTKPNTPTFIKLACGCDKVYIINIDRIVYINENSGLVTLTDGNTIVPTPESMSRLLSALDCH